MIVISIDPGSIQSAFVVADSNSDKLVAAGIEQNATLLISLDKLTPQLIVIEEIKCYGMPVGQSVIDTCYYIGMLIQYANSNSIPYIMYPRKTIVTAICKHPSANDSNIRAAMLDLWGKVKTKGFKADMWSALAIYTAWTILSATPLEGVGAPIGALRGGEGMRTDSLDSFMDF